MEAMISLKSLTFFYLQSQGSSRRAESAFRSLETFRGSFSLYLQSHGQSKQPRKYDLFHLLAIQ